MRGQNPIPILPTEIMKTLGESLTIYSEYEAVCFSDGIKVSEIQHYPSTYKV